MLAYIDVYYMMFSVFGVSCIYIYVRHGLGITHVETSIPCAI